MLFMLIEIKFDIDINNDELLIIIWNIIRKKIVIGKCVAMWSPSLNT